MLLSMNSVSNTYGKHEVIKEISCELSEGVYGLLGANGAGKTTLLNLICRVISPTSGSILLNGKSPSSEEYYSILGFLPQHFNYYPEFTGYDFLIYMSLLKGVKKGQLKKTCVELLELVGLSEVSKKKIAAYSGGMKQRLGIAQALINNPKIIILDEPTVGLDPQERVRFRNLISSLSKDKIIILSTHIVSDIEYIADCILLLKDGGFKEKGTPLELVGLVKDKVWEVHANDQEALKLIEQHIVVNQKPISDGQLLRIISDNQPTPKAKPAEPILEDLYLYYFRKR